MKTQHSFGFGIYLSPFTWRYGSEAMRQIFSEEHKYRLWRRIWVALAAAQHKAGLVDKKELDDLKAQEKNLSPQRILQLEKETKHDVVAAIKEFAEKAKVGGGKIHLGATSMDVVDNADMIRNLEALKLIEKQMLSLLKLFVGLIKKYATLPCLGYTHLQAAEPTTVGYRLAFYAQDLLLDFNLLRFVQTCLRTKGIKGAVGTAASYHHLLEGKKLTPQALEQAVMKSLGLKAALITTQVYPRKFDFFILSLLQSLASSLAKFAGDLRLLQSAHIGEWSEPFATGQVGSSAMPFKRNPIDSEKICSLARFLNQLPAIALENATLSYLERTLDDSANKRVIIPEAFLATEEVLLTAEKILTGLVVNKKRILFNLQQFAPFGATEAILIETVKNGANRQEMHEALREISLKAWVAMQKGEPNPMVKLLKKSPQVRQYLRGEELKTFLKVSLHVGTAPRRALRLVHQIQRTLKVNL